MPKAAAGSTSSQRFEARLKSDAGHETEEQRPDDLKTPHIQSSFRASGDTFPSDSFSAPISLRMGATLTKKLRSYGPDAVLGEIASAFAGIAGVEAVAWCGSTAMQKADSLSDYDLYVYWRTPVSLDARKKIITSRTSEYQLDNTFWELEDEWIEPGGWRFNVLYRSCREAEEEVDRRLLHHVASLGYTTAYCFTVSCAHNLADPNNWLADLQRQTDRTYPGGLLEAIVRKNRPVLGGGMQSCYFEQIMTAIVRQDPVSLNHRIAAWLASYFDILFAINGQFHPGEKRLLTYAGELATGCI